MERRDSFSEIREVKRDVTILIVDDSDFIRERLMELLKDSGIEGTLEQAENSIRALDLVRSVNPDIVILDIRIPGDNGIKTLEIMKRMNPYLPVIILTNYPYEQYREKCLSLGADSFLSKSEDFEKIPGICIDLIENINKS